MTTQTEVRRTYEEQTRKLLALPNESPEADALRDSMDATWLELTDNERAEARRLAAQLKETA